MIPAATGLVLWAISILTIAACVIAAYDKPKEGDKQ